MTKRNTAKIIVFFSRRISKNFRSIWQIQIILCPGRILRLRARGHFIIIFSLIVFYCQIRDFLILFLTAERLLRALGSFGKGTGPIKVRLFSEISDDPVVPFRFYFSESYVTENNLFSEIHDNHFACLSARFQFSELHDLKHA